MRHDTHHRQSGRQQVWIWGVIIAVFVVSSFSPSLYELSRRGDLHADRKFELVHNFYTDYNFYLSRIREGLEGRWTVVEKYTSEPHAGSLIHELYVMMGRIGRTVRVPEGRSGDVYHMARIVLGALLLILSAAFIRRVWRGVNVIGRGWDMIAFLFFLTASSWPTIVAVTKNQIVPATTANIELWRFGGYMSWWSVMDSLQRITFIPHLLAGQALLIFLVMMLTDLAIIRRTRNIVFLGIASFCLGMIFPPGLVFLYGVLGIWTLLHLSDLRRYIAPFFGIVVMSAPAIMYLLLMTSVYPWKRLAELDVLHPLAFSYIEYAKALGPMLPIGILGMIIALVRRERVLYPVVSWVCAWLIFLGLFHFIPQQSPLRFSEMIPHLALGVLAAYLFAVLFQKARGSVRQIWVLVPTALLILGLLQMLSSFLWQKDFVDHKIRATVPLVPTGSYVMYPLRDMTDGMLFLEGHTKRNDVVLSETTAGNYIPVYSGNTVYVGHDNTVRAEEKKTEVRRFFSGDMTPDEARQWLTDRRIRMIFFGPQELEDAKGKPLFQLYPFLSRVYTNTFVSIYTAP